MKIRSYAELEGGSSDLGDQVGRQQERVDERLAAVDSVVGVMSGKGGVGKSLVTAAVATALAHRGMRVGVVDADLNGPSLVRMLGVARGGLAQSDTDIEPARSAGGIALMSMALLVRDDASVDWHEPAEAGFVWRGAQERGALREFLSDVAWGSLDVLLVDLPPGTRRLVDLHELVPGLSGVLAVTIPSGASGDAVARSLDLCARRGIEVFGIVENMSGYRCGGCGHVGPLHAGAAGDDLSARFDVPVLTRLPLDPDLGDAAEEGRLSTWLREESETARVFAHLARTLAESMASDETAGGAR
ncbi:MAG: P-loop NTPase [Gemmatimonadota bacterium]